MRWCMAAIVLAGCATAPAAGPATPGLSQVRIAALGIE